MQTVFYSLYASLMSGTGWMFIFICFALFGLLGFSAHSLFANIIVSVVGACVFLFVARRLTK